MRKLGSLAIFLFCLPQAVGQTGNTQAPLDHIYRAFFGHVAFLQSRAQALPATDPNRASLSAYYQSHIGLSSTDASILTNIAIAADAAVKAQDAKAQAIIDLVRTTQPPGKISSKSALPKPPPELGQLWQGRTEIINSYVQQLQLQMSPSSMQKISSYLKVVFAQQVVQKPIASMVRPPLRPGGKK